MFFWQATCLASVLSKVVLPHPEGPITASSLFHSQKYCARVSLCSAICIPHVAELSDAFPRLCKHAESAPTGLGNSALVSKYLLSLSCLGCDATADVRPLQANLLLAIAVSTMLGG